MVIYYSNPRILIHQLNKDLVKITHLNDNWNFGIAYQRPFAIRFRKKATEFTAPSIYTLYNLYHNIFAFSAAPWWLKTCPWVGVGVVSCHVLSLLKHHVSNFLKEDFVPTCTKIMFHSICFHVYILMMLC